MVNEKTNNANSDTDSELKVNIQPDEPLDDNPTVNDLIKKSLNISRIKDKGMINEQTGSSITIRDNGQINLSSSTFSQYKLNPAGQAMEISEESVKVTNRLRINTDDIIVNDHKLNPKLYEYTDFKTNNLPTKDSAIVGNFCIAGSMLVKAWDLNLQRYVLIRRPVRIPMFSNKLNLPEINPYLGINDPLKIDETITALSDKGYQVNGMITDAKTNIKDANNDGYIDGDTVYTGPTSYGSNGIPNDKSIRGGTLKGKGGSAERFVSVALSQEGFHEEGDNITPYGAMTGANGAPWCASFVSWCARQAEIPEDVIPTFTYCQTGMNAMMRYRNDGSYKPEQGDIAFFVSKGDPEDPDHVGIVTKCDGNTVYTIEGNTSDQVKQRSYPLGDDYCYWFCHPNFAEKGNKVNVNTGSATNGEGTSTI